MVFNLHIDFQNDFLLVSLCTYTYFNPTILLCTVQPQRVKRAKPSLSNSAGRGKRQEAGTNPLLARDKSMSHRKQESRERERWKQKRKRGNNEGQTKERRSKLRREEEKGRDKDEKKNSKEQREKNKC